MRRMRYGAGGTLHANRNGGADPLSLIRSFDSETIPTRPVRPSPLSASTIQGLPLDLIDRLRSFPLFLSAPDSFLAAIGSHLRPQLHNPHDYILTEGDDAKAMYWLVRGSLIVTSRDGESTYAELKPGAFFGEIGILMDIPRTATVKAKLKSLVVRLNKEDLQKVLPGYPEVEDAIRDEATERLNILNKKKQELSIAKGLPPNMTSSRKGKRPRSMDGEVILAEAGMLQDGEVIVSSKKRKSPSPGFTETLASSALGSGSINVRLLLRELPLFATLPSEILHFIGLNAQPMSFPPFHNIIKQGSTGRDVYFIVRGEVEVVNERNRSSMQSPAAKGAPMLILSPPPTDPIVKARLRPGQYFGEVTSLSLAPRRTATVRSISSVEALMISGDVLDELWDKCGPDLRRQVERTARDRLRSSVGGGDVVMADADSTPAIGSLEIEDIRPMSPSTKGMFSLNETMRLDEPAPVGMLDPDPYLNVDLENVRSRSRRGSVAPPSPSTAAPQSEGSGSGDQANRYAHLNGHSLHTMSKFKIDPVSPRQVLANKRARMLRQKQKLAQRSALSDAVLIGIFKHLDVFDLMKLRTVSQHWCKLITNSDEILHNLDLTPYNRWVNDNTVINIICPFVGTRPRYIDISNCFHLTDEGFAALATVCGGSVKRWKMKSVWDITGQAVLEMTNKAKSLEEIDLSNCRKVSDNLLARVIGWVVPELDTVEQVVQQQRQQQQLNRNGSSAGKSGKSVAASSQLPAPGTVVGCPALKRMTLSYCKHITDRSMAHIATHAASRVEELNLTRCTTITDEGFHFWSAWAFPRLTKLCLADCTYLTDNAIIWLTHAARSLTWLDLSFCCALSDIATEVLALGCPQLEHLNLAFCGSAVSDASLRVISRHLLELRELSVRGCVRVTGIGVESVVEGCEQLESFEVSQCRNLVPWIEQGGREKIWRSGRDVRFAVWAGEQGAWGVAKEDLRGEQQRSSLSSSSSIVTKPTTTMTLESLRKSSLSRMLP